MNEKATKILTQLSLLLGPPSLVAFFCSFLGIEGETSAGISILIFIAICILMFHQLIDRLIKPTYLLLFFFLLLAILYFAIDNIVFKNTGLIQRYERSNDYLSEFGKHIGKAKKDVWLYGTNFHISATDKQDVILKKVSEGVSFNFLISNPYDTILLTQISKDTGTPLESLLQECMSSYNHINLLIEKSSNIVSDKRGSINVKLLSHTPYFRGYIIDPERKNGRSFIIPYVNGYSSPQLPGYLFENTKASVMQVYYKSIINEWNSKL